MFNNDSPFLLPADEYGRQIMTERIFCECERAERYEIGRSVLGRSIEALKIGKGRGRVAIFGTHHALESITANVLYAFVYIMLSGNGRELILGDCDRGLFLSMYTYFIIPCLNPDGVELRYHGEGETLLSDRQRRMSGGDYSSWQANGRGVDLNHNYDFGFAEYKEIERERGIMPGASLYSGEYPESEPETHAAAAFVRALAPKAVVSLHTQGEEIFYSPTAAARGAARMAELTGYRLSMPTDTAAYGGLCDYTGGVLGIPSFTLELGRGKNPLSETLVPQLVRRVGHALLRLPSLF